MSTIRLEYAVLQKEEVHKTLGRLRAEAKFTDISFVTRRKYDGKVMLIDAHQMAFSEISETLTDMFRDVQKKMPNTRVFVTVDEFDSDIVEMLIDYIYGIEINVTSREWEELRKLCKILGISLPLQNEPLDWSFSNDSLGEARNASISEGYSLLETTQELIKGLIKTEDPESHTISSDICISDAVTVQDKSDSFFMAETQRVVDKSKNLQKEIINIPEPVEINEEMDQCKETTNNKTCRKPSKMKSNSHLKKYLCKECGLNFASNESLRIHRTKANANPNSFRCDQCHFSTNYTISLQAHVDGIHKGVFKYICELCEYGTNQSFNLKEHIKRIHLEPNAHKCNRCEFSTGTKINLIMHKQAVHEGVKHKCNQCEFSTSRMPNLIQHKKVVHEGVKYQCSLCDYSSSYKVILKGHLFKKHNQGDVIKCDLCSYTTWKKSLITIHKNDVHPQL